MKTDDIVGTIVTLAIVAGVLGGFIWYAFGEARAARNCQLNAECEVSYHPIYSDELHACMCAKPAGRAR